MSRSANWVPSTIRWSAAGPFAEWCHLGDLRFTHPFFEQTIEGAMRQPFNLLFAHRTPLAGLMNEAQPDLKLSGLIFHMSRCGSTVLTQMLAALSRNVVLSEPAPLDQVLQIRSRMPDVPQEQVVQLMRGMVLALGRKRHTDERNVFIKLDAWHVLLLPLFRQAFPDVPWIFLYREPLEVLASLDRTRPAQMFPGRLDPALLRIAPEQIGALGLDDYTAAVLAAYLRAAIEHHADGGLLMSYEELPAAACTRMLDHFGLRCEQPDIAAMLAAARFDAKNPGAPFSPDVAEKRNNASEDIRRLAQGELAVLHARLEALRSGL